MAEIAERASYQTAEVGYAQGEVIGIDGCEAPSFAPPETEQGRALPAPPACQLLSVGLIDGPDKGQIVDVEARGSFAVSGLRTGDEVQLTTFPNGEAGQAGASTRYHLTKNYEVSGIVRHLPLAISGLLFAAVVIAVGRLRGLLALVALGVAAGVLLAFVLPALVAGGPRCV